MTYDKVYLSLEGLEQSIKGVLEDYCEYDCQGILNSPQAKQQLTQKVIHTLPKKYILVEDNSFISEQANHHHSSLEDRLQLQVLITRLMKEVLAENSCQIKKTSETSDYSTQEEPSHWFG